MRVRRVHGPEDKGDLVNTKSLIVVPLFASNITTYTRGIHRDGSVLGIFNWDKWADVPYVEPAEATQQPPAGPSASPEGGEPSKEAVPSTGKQDIQTPPAETAR